MTASEPTPQRAAWRDQALWGGPRPPDPLGSIPQAAPVATVDLALAEELAATDHDRLRVVARVAARAALAEAGLDSVDWVRPALDALATGGPLPAPFDDPARAVDRLFADPRVVHTGVTSPDGHTEHVSQQAMGLFALVTAADPDPVSAVFAAVQHAQLTFGRDRMDVLHNVLMELLG
jgi:hypothetical protein